MKHTLLMRLEGPMQSWGTQSRFKHRDSGFEPSKSGVLGILCAAMGWPRDENGEAYTRATHLRMGVRVDREGLLNRDFHTTANVPTADGRGTGTVTSQRYYLADASFVVGLEGDDEDLSLLADLNSALREPRWQLYLGRKSFPPARPVYMREGVVKDHMVEEALQLPAVAFRLGDHRPRFLRNVLETPSGEVVRIDQPVGPFSDRYCIPRRVTVVFRPIEDYAVVEDWLCTSQG